MSEKSYAVLVTVTATGLVALAAFLATRKAQASASTIVAGGELEEITVTARRISTSPNQTDFVGPMEAWAAPAQYLSIIRYVEKDNGMPPRLLERLLYQESRYRADIISGAVTSSAGAVGIAQIVPKWHPEIDPLNTTQAIQYAGKYLATLRNQFGDWRKALAAYNWGPGNLSKVNLKIPLWLSQAPTETRRYVEEITRDVPV